MSATGSGIAVEVPVASMLTVKATAVGAVQAKAVHEHTRGSIVMEIVLVEPEFEPQLANVVVTVKVSVIYDEIVLPYCCGSIVSVFAPLVTDESVMAAQVVTEEPSPLVIA